MTFTTRIKDEITKDIPNNIESRIELLSYLKYASAINSNKIVILIENASVARYIFRLIKTIYNININLTIRTVKRFKVKKMFILSITEKVEGIKTEINDINDNVSYTFNFFITIFISFPS